MNKVNFYVLFLMLQLFVPWRAMAQDERYFRQLFSGELIKKTNSSTDKKYSYFLHTPFYSIDLNHDGVAEQVVFVKKDSEDWIEIYDQSHGTNKTKIFSYQFEPLGFDSDLYRIEFKKLSAQTSILILYYFEGISRYAEMQSTSRIYFITIDNNDLKTFAAYKGPSIFEEKKSLKGHYHLRNYQVYLQDLNNDDVKEVVVKHRGMSQVYIYKGHGNWKSF